jgi:hypothetical protein
MGGSFIWKVRFNTYSEEEKITAKAPRAPRTASPLVVVLLGVLGVLAVNQFQGAQRTP